MDEGNLYPRSTEYFMPPENKKLEEDRKAEDAAVAREITVINEVIESLNERIAFYSSFESIPKDIEFKSDEFSQACLAHKRAAEVLRGERDKLMSLVASIVKE